MQATTFHALRPYRKPSRRRYSPVVPHGSPCYKASIIERARLLDVVASQREVLARSGYSVPDEVTLPFAHGILRDLADRTSVFCTKHAHSALTVMRLVRQCVPGLLPKVR